MAPVAFALMLTGAGIAAAGLGNPDLAVVAAASPRPRVCMTDPQGSVGSVWERARMVEESAYCAALAGGYARLVRQPTQALGIATTAETTWPREAAPLVLAGRALFALGRPAEATAKFDRALALDRHAVDSPDALHDRAAAALLAQDLETAERAYRALVPRVGLLADDARARRVLVEAAAVVMGEGPQALAEAVSYLGEARRHTRAPGLRPFVLGLLALTLSRQGLLDQARGVVAEADGALLPLDDPAVPPAPGRSSALPVLPPGELQAIAATLAEGVERQDAIDQWNEYVGMVGEQGVWIGHARGRLAALTNQR
ncbi:MAG: hypothetical protein JW751_32225 [Polyangiaceae bacterium]|nr:hypothetical protein [Polyangiaceae bacterium]